MDELRDAQRSVMQWEGWQQAAGAIGALVGGMLAIRKVMRGIAADAPSNKPLSRHDVDWRSIHDHLDRIEGAIHEQDGRIETNFRRLDAIDRRLWKVERSYARNIERDQPKSDSIE